ncbi:hypothetical protein CVT25_007266 [Psilocybe cyanescens]|uniref:Uncharacterized protein n=1 Tax=Psilocybe cyanescens TaxID=93625 RepID=A0A409XPC0_PSICY|nr:hypothetical protein CVT25_007266 [Psilocybe cyanescens]
MDMMIFRESVNISKSSWSQNEDEAYAVAETVLSPAKYALFQFLGYKLIEITCPVSNFSSTTSIKVGAWGGAALTLVHISVILLCRKYPHNGVANYQMLCKEMICSAAGSIIGALYSGLNNRQALSTFAIAGFFGPVVFLVILFGILGLAIVVGWTVERVKVWWKRR